MGNISWEADYGTLAALRTPKFGVVSLRRLEGEMVKSAFVAFAVAIAFVCSAVVTEARVTRIEIAKVERVEPPSPGAQGATQTPPYERMSGKFYGELDPADPKNALITDIQLAPRNARGKVEYVGTFSLMKPVDMSQGERRADLFGRQSRQRRGSGERRGTHLARQRLAGRRRADRHQSDDSGAAREES